MSIIEKAVDKLTAEDSAVVPSPKDLSDAPAGVVAESGSNETDFDAAHARFSADNASGSGMEMPDIDVVDPGQVDISFTELNLEGSLSPQSGRSRLDEEYRMIKRPLLVTAFSG
ncbi:MAG: hypothetical protein KDI74_13970, partial [Gammaproteobacteria bacterium]|nr:hypothetical protein [Gammaproteobacteria bacterium]